MTVKTSFLTTAIILACSVLSCKNNIERPTRSVVKDSAQKENIATEKFNDTVFNINGSRLSVEQLSVNCNQPVNDSEKEVRVFLNSNIQYFKTDTIFADQLNAEIYYRSLLKGTHFLAFGDSSFNKENFTFSVTQSAIKNYGACYIGKYFFPSAVNAAQRRATVIINPAKKEISIWNFDDVNIFKDGLICDFNVRGKHTIYKMSYSVACKSFVANPEGMPLL